MISHCSISLFGFSSHFIKLLQLRSLQFSNYCSNIFAHMLFSCLLFFFSLCFAHYKETNINQILQLGLAKKMRIKLYSVTETYLAFCDCKNIIKHVIMQKACTQSNFASVSRPHAVTPPWISLNNGLYKTELWPCSLIEMKHDVNKHIFYKPDISMPKPFQKLWLCPVTWVNDYRSLSC